MARCLNTGILELKALSYLDPLYPNAVVLFGTDEITSRLGLFCKLLASREHHVRSEQGVYFRLL